MFGLILSRPTNLSVNANVDAMYADNSFTEISPRQIQHYRVRSMYKARPWMNLSGTLNIFESRNNVRPGASSAPCTRLLLWRELHQEREVVGRLELRVQRRFSQIDECYTVLAVPALGTRFLRIAALQRSGQGARQCPPLLSTGYYNEPTQFGSISVMLAPVKRVHANVGYRMSAVDGHEQALNSRFAPGSLQSQY